MYLLFLAFQISQHTLREYCRSFFLAPTSLLNGPLGPAVGMSPFQGEAAWLIWSRHPLNLYAGLLPSDPGEDNGGGEGSTGRDAEL